MASEYGWLIHREYLGSEMDHTSPRNEEGMLKTPNQCEVFGPSDISDEMQLELKTGLAGSNQGHKRYSFKCYDDDGNNYYEGFITGEFEGYEPLRDYATPNAGAVLIRYNGHPELDSEWA